MAAFQVLTIPELLSAITNFHRNHLDDFIRRSRASGILQRRNSLLRSHESEVIVAKKADVATLEAIYLGGVKLSWKKITDACVDKGRADLIEWIHQNEIITIPIYEIISISQKSMPAVKWLYLNNLCKLSPCLHDTAARRGQLHVIKLLHELNAPGFSKSVMDNAAICGHFHVVKWLHENREEGCGDEIMDYLAAENYLNSMKWLHANLGMMPSMNATLEAARNDHLRVLKWIHKTFKLQYPSQAIEIAIDNDNIEIVKFISAHYPVARFNETPIEYAISKHRVRIVKWLARNTDASGKTLSDAIKRAIFNNNLDTLRWLYNWSIADYTNKTLELAKESGNAEIIEWLEEFIDRKREIAEHERLETLPNSTWRDRPSFLSRCLLSLANRE